MQWDAWFRMSWVASLKLDEWTSFSSLLSLLDASLADITFFVAPAAAALMGEGGGEGFGDVWLLVVCCGC